MNFTNSEEAQAGDIVEIRMNLSGKLSHGVEFFPDGARCRIEKINSSNALYPVSVSLLKDPWKVIAVSFHEIKIVQKINGIEHLKARHKL